MTGMDISPLLITCKVAVLATVISTLLAVPLAYLITGMKRGIKLADAFFSLPLVLPPTVVGFFLLIFFGGNSPVGRLLRSINLDVVFTAAGAVIASVVISFPIIYRTARAAFDAIDEDLVDTARLLGFYGVKIFAKVYVPLAFRELATGVILAFARTMGEFGATIMIAGNIPGRTRTMSVAVYTAMQSGDRSLAYTWTVVILCMSFVMLFLLDALAGRRYAGSEKRRS